MSFTQRSLFLTTLATLLYLPGAAAFAQQDTEALQEVLQDVRSRAGEVDGENRAREQEFTAERDQRQVILNATRAELQRETERGERLRAQFDTNEVTLEQLGDALRIRTGDLGELFGVFRQQLADAGDVIDESLITVNRPARKDTIRRLTELNEVPAISDLRALHVVLLEEMTESSAVTRFRTELSDATGIGSSAEVVRIGVFNAVSADGYLQLDADGAGLSVLPRQPSRRYQKSAENFFAATSGTARLAIDPSRGSLLGLVIQSPGLVEQATYGGGIGYTILLMGVIGLSIALWRFFSLRQISARVTRQLKTPAASNDNPLGRVLAVYVDNKNSGIEVLERKLDEAILHETPKLEKYQGVIKVIAGVAPLMGLLGTVVGMIRTFQTITLFGTSDPKLMADGISQALVTTVEGLLVAIPLVFLHALVSDRSRELTEILEEQSAGIVARHLEAKGGVA